MLQRLLGGLCHYLAEQASSGCGKRDRPNKPYRAIQLHVTATGISVSQENIILFQKAGESYWSRLVFYPPLQCILTRLGLPRTYQGEHVVIPNSVVFTSPVQILTAQPQRRIDLAVGVDYNTPLTKATSVLMKALKTVDEVKSTPSPEVDIVEFGDSSINLVARYWTHPEQKCVRRIRTQVMVAVKQAFDEADIGIPYPIRTLYFYNQDQYNDFQLKPQNTHADSGHFAAKS